MSLDHRVHRARSRWATRPWWRRQSLPVAVAFLAMVLALPSLWAGWMADDHVLRLRLTGSVDLPELDSPVLDLFAFANGDPERMSRLMDLGFWPWWTLKELRASFFRPLACLTHWLDLYLWPDQAMLMHLQSLLWFGGLVAVVALLYRRVMGPTLAAALAALLFAIDDAHGTPVGFIANRNALLATLFGVMAVLAHIRWRRDSPGSGWVRAALGPSLLALSMLSAEFGAGVLAYLISYAVFLDRGTWRSRLTSLLPYVLVIVVWRIIWTGLGHGMFGTDFYIDPGAEPARFVIAVLRRAPVLLLGQWVGPPADLFSLFTVAVSPILARVMWLGAVAVLGLVGAAMVRVLRMDRAARFWAVGMMLSVVPVCATYPQDRTLLLVGVGAFGLLGCFLSDAFGRLDGPPATRAGRRRRTSGRVPALLLVAIHAVLAPIALPLRAWRPAGPRSLMQQIFVNTPMDRSVEEQDVVLVNTPIALAAGYVPMLRALNGQPIPRHTWALSASWSPTELSRPDSHTLVVRPDWGYLNGPIDTLARSLRHPMAVGDRVEFTGVTIEVTALTEDGRPAEATCRFDVSLEDSSLRWLRWKDGEFVPFTPPAVGETVHLPAAIPSLTW